MAMHDQYNIYQGTSGGWVVEVLLYPKDRRPEWYRIGVFGTRRAALAHISK